MFAPAIIEQAARLLDLCRDRNILLATAESCTGGLVAAALTTTAGSSDVFERGFVTYSNEAKAAMLGVPIALLTSHGAVSEPVARAMAEGAIRHSRANLAASVTGVAGPGGGSVEKPVGLVWIAAARLDQHGFGGSLRDSAKSHEVDRETKQESMMTFGHHALGGAVISERHLFPGDRAAVREASVAAALSLLTRLAQ